MKIKQYVILLFLTLICLRGFSTHIVGGEIFYDYLGNDNYKITLKVYRDCYSGVPPFDDPAFVGIYDINNNLVLNVDMGSADSTLIPSIINNPCLTPPANVCVREGVYTAIVNLPPIVGGYVLDYQRCCRNASILNIVDPNNTGSTYEISIPGTGSFTSNSSPRFNQFPPLFLCSGVPLHFDNSASDPDGDSLHYEFCDAFDGGSSTGPNPVPPGPPPFAFVNYQSPYSASFPMSSSPLMTINPNTGLITGTPNMLGRWVVAVCVSEYRNGVLVSVNKRDFQFNVVNCPNIPVASIPAQQTFCQGFQVDFSQNSLNAFTYHWDFGDPTTLSDTSNISSPIWTFANPGVYTVTLTINPGTLCVDTAQNQFIIEPLLAPTFTPPNSSCLNGNHFNFTAAGAFQGNGTFHWDFGSSAVPSTSNLQNPTNIVFTTPGNHPVTLTISENGCTQSHTDTVHVFAQPNGNFNTSTNVSCILNPVQFVNTSTGDGPMTYAWSFDNGLTSTLQNPTTIYSAIGTYNVTLIVTSVHGCIDTVTLPNQLVVQNPPIASFTYSPLCDNHQINFTQTCNGAVFYQWNFGDPATVNDTSSIPSPSWQYFSSGTYTAVLTINPGSSCTATTSQTFFVYPTVAPDFVRPTGQCLYNNNFSFTAGGSFMGTGTFDWNFDSHANPTSSTLQNPTNIVFDTLGAHPVTLTITEHGCTKSHTDSVYVYAKPHAHFGSSTVGCALDPINFIDSSTADSHLIFQWDFGNGLTSYFQNPTTIYQQVGTYTVTEIITTEHGCKDTFSLPNSLHVFPTPTAAFSVSPRDTNVYYPNISLADQSQSAVNCWIYWGDGSVTNSCGDTIHHYSSPGVFSIMQIVQNSFGCYDTAYSSVEILPQFIFWIPNAFTPSGDGLNDIFKPAVWGVHQYKFYIFDRWGEKIYETEDYQQGWDGTFNGRLCTNDVYVYKISFTDDVAGNSHQYIGSVTLVK